MADLPLALLPHTVQVETYLGSGAYGDMYAAPQPVRCKVDDVRQLVLSPSGDQIVSQSTLLARLSEQPKFTPKSKVTTPWGRAAVVIGVGVKDDGGMGAWQHIEVSLS